MVSCLFCRITSGEAEAQLVFEDEHVAAFRDINPQAPVHILVVPKRHVSSLAQCGDEDTGLLGRLLAAAASIARSADLDRDGYRLVINTGSDGGQTVDHLHLHILGGRAMGWPPG